MWFVFPQLQGLGHSEMANRYAIASLAKASAYVEHPVLGLRLRECCELLLKPTLSASAFEIFGSPDNLKLQSSMTLFALASPSDECFEQVLDKFFDGIRDHRTLELLQKKSMRWLGSLAVQGGGKRARHSRPCGWVTSAWPLMGPQRHGDAPKLGYRALCQLSL